MNNKLKISFDLDYFDQDFFISYIDKYNWIKEDGDGYSFNISIPFSEEEVGEIDFNLIKKLIV